MNEYRTDLIGFINRLIDDMRQQSEGVGASPQAFELFISQEARSLLLGVSLEASYHWYAALINHSRPHRKVSWRRLNRRQRSRAVTLFPGAAAIAGLIDDASVVDGSES